jgi:MYXO-CTERM domain-containing protein
LNFLPRPLNEPGAGLWWEDGVATGHFPGQGMLSAGAPVIIGVPEPSSSAAGAVGAAGLALFARRRRRREGEIEGGRP